MNHTITKRILSPLLDKLFLSVWIPSKEKNPGSIPLNMSYSNIFPVDKDQTLLTNTIDAINQAKETIFIASFLFSHKELTDALKKAAERDVRIYLLTASENKLKISPEEGDFEDRTLEEHKKFLNEMSQMILIRSAENFHFKTLLVDAANKEYSKGFIFTSNLTEKALSENAEIGFSLEGDEISDLAKYFTWCFWENATHEQSLSQQHKPIKMIGKFNSPVPKSKVIFSGNGIHKDCSIQKHLYELIDSAKSNLEIASFSFSEKESDLTRKICEKAKKGVHVNIYGRENRSKQFELFDFLQWNGVNIIGIPLLHLKLIIADNEIGILMTANLDERSLSTSMEVGILLTKEQVSLCKNILNSYKDRFHFQYNAKLDGISILKKRESVSYVVHYIKNESIPNTLKILDNSPEHIEKKKINCVTDLLRHKLEIEKSQLEKYGLVEEINYKWEFELPILGNAYIESNDEKDKKSIFPIYIFEEKDKKGKILKQERVLVLEKVDEDLANVYEAQDIKVNNKVNKVVIRRGDV